MPILTMSVMRWPVWPRQAPLAHGGDEPAHPVEHAVHVRHHVPAVDQDRPVAAVAQGDVQHRAVLGVVDLGSPSNIIARQPSTSAWRGEVDAAAHGLGVDAVLAVVEQQVLEPEREPAEALGIGGEQLAQRHLADAQGVGGQGLPGGGRGQRRHDGSP